MQEGLITFKGDRHHSGKTIGPFLRHSQLANCGYFNLMLLNIDYSKSYLFRYNLNALFAVHKLFSNIKTLLSYVIEPGVGYDPTTYALQVRRATNYAIQANLNHKEYRSTSLCSNISLKSYPLFLYDITLSFIFYISNVKLDFISTIRFLSLI